MITIDEIARTADVGVRRRPTASFASGMVDIVRVRIIKMVFAFEYEVAVECGRKT